MNHGRNTVAPIKFGMIEDVFIQATFDSGAAVLDEDNSSPGVSIEKDATGDYDVTFPAGNWVHVVGCQLAQVDDTPGTSWVECAPGDFDASAGTGKVLSGLEDDTSGIWTQADVPDGARLYLHLKVGRPV